MEGKTTVVLKGGPKRGAVLELFVQELPDGVRGDARLQAGCVLDPLTDHRNAACRCLRAAEA
eukprot:15130668-Alexandrium_andersonii.AAC.1